MTKVPRYVRTAATTLVLPIYFSVAFATFYIGGLHHPKPHHVEVAIVGPLATTASLAHSLSTTPKNGYLVSQLTSIADARRLVRDRKLAAAYVPGARPAPTVIVATAASASLSSFVEGTFRTVAAAQGRPLAVDDVRPLPPDNATGTPNFFFTIICTLGGFLTMAAMAFTAPKLPESQRFAIAGAAAILTPLVAYLIAGPGYGTFGGPFWTIVAMLAMGALYAFVVAAITRGMQLALGSFGALIGSLVFIFLNFPSSGGTVASELLPGFWRFLNDIWIGAAALDANRSILYFDGADVGDDVLAIVAWLAAWAVVLSVPFYLKKRRQRTAVSATTGSSVQARAQIPATRESGPT